MSCQYKNGDSYVFCGFFHVKYSDAVPQNLSGGYSARDRQATGNVKGTFVCIERYLLFRIFY